MSILTRATAVLGVGRANLAAASAAALVTGFLTIVTCLSYPALIFANGLEAHLPLGIGAAFASAVVLGTVVALFGSYPGAIAYAQSETALVIGVMAATAAGALAAAGRGEAVVPTLVVLMPLGAFAVGVFFVALGRFRLGNLIRYAPYPVVAGFLAGVGWFLVRAAIASSAGQPLTPDSVAAFLDLDAAMRWAPAAAGGTLLWALQRRRSHPLNLPAVVCGAVAVFWIAAAIAGTPVDRLRAAGWLLGPFADGTLWAPDRLLQALPHAAWDLLPGLVAEFATLLLLAVISFLMLAGAIEISTRRDIDFNRELVTVGTANLLAAVAGGLPGFHSTGGSILTHRLGTPVRFVGLATAVLAALALGTGAAWLGYVPRLAVGIVLFYIGLGFLADALRRDLGRMRPAESAVMLLVFGVIAAAGFMQGIGVGVAAALAIFAVSYARVPVVRSALTVETYHSNVERAPALSAAIRAAGQSALVLKLQGYIFFGTAHQVVELVRERLSARPPLRFLMLDFRAVSGLDSSATASFDKLTRYAGESGFAIAYASVPERAAAVLGQAGLLHADRPPVRAFADADRALEWIEDRMLAERGLAADTGGFLIAEQLSAIYPDPAEAQMFRERLSATRHAAGDVLVHQGAAADDLFIVEAGRITIGIELKGGGTLRLRTMGPGTVVGEIAFYRGTPRSASVIADADTRVWRLTRAALAAIESTHPAVAIRFHENMARLLAGRLAETNRLLAEVLH